MNLSLSCVKSSELSEVSKLKHVTRLKVVGTFSLGVLSNQLDELRSNRKGRVIKFLSQLITIFVPRC
jgi:hypothetical protein